ncbi:MAG: methyltransferase domain-containing protein [Coriobacteriales bacterium]
MGEGTERVREHYAEVATECCICAPADSGEAWDLYSEELLSRLPVAALAASRGCGDPVSVAGLKTGEHVLDLGSGGGVDALIASALVGEEGLVYGVDMTEEMVELARSNAAEAGAANISFLHGQIEEIPLPDACVDAVISNCVINLSEDKPAVLREACRVLRPGGRLVVSDIVAFKPIPIQIEPQMRRITGCLNGMLNPEDYARELRSAGFERSTVEPKTVYTFEVLGLRCEKKGRTALLEQAMEYPEASGATGSAIVRAWKGM